MNKKELLQTRRLKATSRMVQIARKDIPKTVSLNYGGRLFQDTRRQYQLFLRCCVVKGDILKVSLYYPDNLRAEGRMPSYEVYIDRSARRFITYDCISDKWLNAKLDRLNWPHYVPMYPCAWSTAADAKLAAEYLNSEVQGYEAVLNYQLELRREALLRRHKKETDLWDADMALIPALPKDWEHWVDKVGIPQNFIFYQYKKRGAKTGYCTYCGKDVMLRDKPSHNKTGRCPCCRHEITYKAIGWLGWHLDTKEVCVYLIQAKQNGFVVREFWASRRYCKKDYKHPTLSCIEHWRMVYDYNLSAHPYYWGKYKTLDMRWIAGVPSCTWMGYNSIYNSHGCQVGRIYGKTLPHLAKGPLKHTGLVDWLYAHGLVAYPDKYLLTLCKIPQLEQIWKAGLTELANLCMQNSVSARNFIKAPDASRLTKALGIDKQQLTRLRQHNGETSFLCWLQWEKQCGKAISDDVIQWFCDQKIPVRELDFIQGKMNPLQVRNYLQRQAASSGDTMKQVLTTWKDYLSMAERLGIDTNDEIVYRVKLLRQRHDELVLRRKQQESQNPAEDVLKKFPDVDDICRSIKEKYEYSDEQYSVLAPNGVADIIVEGAFQCHCLGSSDRYWDRIERQESFILFLRRTSAPHIPYYTLEIEPDGTIRQKRTKFDRQEDDIKEATEFLMEWQKVVTKRITTSDRKKAAASRILREQEFEQMRRENVIIHTGDLAGKRLVDVLVADLMENAA